MPGISRGLLGKASGTARLQPLCVLLAQPVADRLAWRDIEDFQRRWEWIWHIAAIPKPPTISNRLRSGVLVGDAKFAHVFLRMAVNLIKIKAKADLVFLGHRFALQRRIGWGRESQAHRPFTLRNRRRDGVDQCGDAGV